MTVNASEYVEVNTIYVKSIILIKWNFKINLEPLPLIMGNFIHLSWSWWRIEKNVLETAATSLNVSRMSSMTCAMPGIYHERENIGIKRLNCFTKRKNFCLWDLTHSNSHACSINKTCNYQSTKLNMAFVAVSMCNHMPSMVRNSLGSKRFISYNLCTNDFRLGMLG